MHTCKPPTCESKNIAGTKLFPATKDRPLNICQLLQQVKINCLLPSEDAVSETKTSKACNVKPSETSDAFFDCNPVADFEEAHDLITDSSTVPLATFRQT
jgi:hypothetical protein